MRLSYLILSWVLPLGALSITPKPPSQDGFYRLPPGHENAKPGSILDYRKHPYPFKHPLPETVADAYQILYGTTDNFGRPTAAVATILIPLNADPQKIFVNPQVQNSASVDCSPSYTIATGVESSKSDSFLGLAHRLVLAAALNQGWYVILPDHEGLNAAFLANRRGAYTILDSIRATLSSAHFTHVSPAAKVAIMGHSGASSSAALALELQESYAPELHIVGGVIGGLIPKLQETINNVLPSSPLFPIALHGLANEYPTLNSIIEHNLVEDPERVREFKHYRTLCMGSANDMYKGKDSSYYFENLDFVNSTIVQGIFSDNNLLQGHPRVPLLVYESERDDISPVAETDRLVSQYCAAGVSVDYQKVTLESHSMVGIDLFFVALPWVKDRLDGLDMERGCKRSTRLSILTDPASVRFFPEAITGSLERLLGDKFLNE